MQMEILEEFSGSNDHAIVKGKRTKRPRPSSSASSSGGGSGGGGVEVHNSLLVSYSPTTSSGISTSTEEDEDMANCLILLARGGSPPPIKAVEGKFSSRKFAEMATTAAGKVGIYVYECKTCNRTFPSFQALGGHRASHKKPKPTTDDDQKKSPPAPPPPDYQEEEEAPPPSTQLPNNKSCHNYGPNKPKIHECSICGSEFASGQALGGHMRRHRTAPSTAGTRIGTSVDNDSPTTSHDVSEKTRNTLEFDLNLPAEWPEDDKLHDHEFPEAKQQPRLVFSAAALVDCHY
ncbi:UNVERIFIED_CONTAM: Zinc finger protein ZAT5 [Sesamum radiatum]|uniref:Zinc finger protein ZAT5 n=1 Tax=Sesamum radiatum TaxID=300843 RepID=A0AAW2W6S7_SESRA